MLDPYKLIAEWVRERTRQKVGYWYDPYKWHPTPWFLWWRWLRGQRYRRQTWATHDDVGYEYATEQQVARIILAEQFSGEKRPKVYFCQMELDIRA